MSDKNIITIQTVPPIFSAPEMHPMYPIHPSVHPIHYIEHMYPMNPMYQQMNMHHVNSRIHHAYPYVFIRYVN